MAPVFSKPALFEVVETSSALAASDGHHKHAVVLVVVVVAIAGATIVYLAYRLVTRYLKERRETQDLEAIDVVAIQDVEKGSDTEISTSSSPFVFVPADTAAIEAKAVPVVPITPSTPSNIEINWTPPLITAFSPRVEIEDTDDREDEDVDAAPEANPDPFALFTRPSPNMLSFWMKPDPAFIRAGSATGRKLVIGGKTFILDEVVVERRVFAEKTVTVCRAAEVEECDARIEEWPVHDEPTEPEASADTPTPRMEEQEVVDCDDVVVGELGMKVEDCPAQDGAGANVAASEIMPSMESIPTVASTPSPSPTPSGKSSSKLLRKPLATLKANIPLQRGASKKPSTTLKSTRSTAPSPLCMTKPARAPVRPLPKDMGQRTPAKSAVSGLAMKKSGSLPLASRGSVTSNSADVSEPAEKPSVPLRSAIKRSVSLPSSSHLSQSGSPKSGKKLPSKPTTPPVLIPSPRATIFSIPEINSPLRAKSKPGPPDVIGTPKGGFKRSSSLGGKMGVGLTPKTPARPPQIWR